MKREKGLPDPIDLQEERLLRPPDAAQFLSVSENTLKWWRNSAHRGPSFVRVEGGIRYPVQALRRYLAARTVRAPKPRKAAPFYRRTRIEELGEKHPGLRNFVEKQQHRRVPHPQIAAAVLEKWGEVVSEQVLSNFYRLRVWPKECNEAREPKVKGES
jgi:hypothetical protein